MPFSDRPFDGNQVTLLETFGMTCHARGHSALTNGEGMRHVLFTMYTKPRGSRRRSHNLRLVPKRVRMMARDMPQDSAMGRLDEQKLRMGVSEGGQFECGCLKQQQKPSLIVVA